jgi:hypothetical protein
MPPRIRDVWYASYAALGYPRSVQVDPKLAVSIRRED